MRTSGSTDPSDIDTDDINDLSASLPAAQHLAPDDVLVELAEAGSRRAMNLSVLQVLILSTIAGGFITIGALFSTLIATGTDNEGVKKLLEGFGFSVGFFLVVLSGTLLFTEANVEMPAALLSRRHRPVGVTSLRSAVLRLWILAAVGNMAGAFLLGQVIAYSHSYGPQFNELLGEITESKVRYQDVGGVEGYFQAILSGMMGNWLVGMAAFLATMGRTIIGKYIPVLVTVMAFVAGGFLHSPANMAYLSLSQPLGIGPGWGEGFVWAIVPAAIGNILGAFFLVALPFWITTTRCSDTQDTNTPRSAA